MTPADLTNFENWRSDFIARAEEEGVSPRTIRLFLEHSWLLPDVLERQENQKEILWSVRDYLDITVSDERVRKGRKALRANRPLMAALESLLPDVLSRWSIGPIGVIGHSDMAPGRKIDPGRRFDWQRLARQGLAVWPDVGETTVDAAQFRADAQAFGYPEVEDALLLDVVRLRFRPWARGPLDAVDCAMMADLAARFGLDRIGCDG